MGYYNEGYPPNPHRRKKRKYYWVLSMLVGLGIGVFLAVQVIPSFAGTQNEKTESFNKVNMEQNGQGEIPGEIINTSVNVDVSTQITEIVNKVTPAVVGVSNLMESADYWHQSEVSEVATGSGVIYKVKDGNAYVVTNHHVIEGADEVEVILYNETSIPAEIIGSDIFTDLAVLRMDASNVEKVIDIGSSGNVKVGEPAIAIGNPLGHMFSSTVTQGVISGKERTIPQDFDQDGRADWQAEVIQTDAAINPGNSGGALINISGQLIGINSMKINQEAVEGIAFSIPIDFALPVMNELENTGEVVRPYLGVEIYSLDEVPQAEWKDTLKLPKDVEGGVYVWTVEPLSPADRAGLKQLDVITALDDKPTMSMIDLRKILYQEKKIGEKVKVTYYRNGKRKETTFELGAQ
ncbi:MULTISPECIES: S1C family serine protease [Bacillaceae]|uniref:Serine protease n=1 Tax=Oceanobacillus caeni TaxID=405946 RepID=A0ABR5MGS6_9BACI|nr:MULTISPECIES: trypsin-like peptidase domain-containing protein [Bacillaceae]KPH72121.1 serine protease [Oceanobacillus caeni]MBU8790846.1 trypsin-like peptidase domain-containing protein [Oceanobacillus caeni]MED4473302.1 trypsin-like peptidase domain-containing protein [Oceanobacillus caeni]